MNGVKYRVVSSIEKAVAALQKGVLNTMLAGQAATAIVSPNVRMAMHYDAVSGNPTMLYRCVVFFMDKNIFGIFV